MILTSYALALGFVHGLGADHLMAIAALSVRAPGDERERTHPMRVALGFALGHALLLLLGSAAVVLLGWQIPVLLERTGEVVGGVLLIALGAFSLWVAFSQRSTATRTHTATPVTRTGTCIWAAAAVTAPAITRTCPESSARCSPCPACAR